jgi:beta-phosphoglucomutase-like phosphatase (HAD superfamily)
MSPRRQGEDSARVDTSLVECLVVAVPEMTSFGSVADALAQMVESAAIRILDLVVVTRSRSDHKIRVVELADIESLPAQLLVSSHFGALLSENDIALAAIGLLPGSVGAVLLVEDRWAGPLSSAAKRAGGRVLGGERISRSRVEAALVDRPSEPGIP